ncbi:monoacylglycerol lipase ABHD12-like [Gouania willdenowi]|uniref:Serine aminopeptidase S33 domain-containing protein n=1 Tax=Gouania willdenowi TaxID=441366 RepID=A0A8C5N7Y8_GOUWI|nr:protein ABHD12B [Gouania willdenowi]
MNTCVSVLLTVYASVPVILYLFPWILGHVIYAHLLRLPFFVDLSRPEDVLNNTWNFYLNTEEDISVGVWHTLPVGQYEENDGREPGWHQETLGDGHPVVIYLHGNVGTRAIHHRVQLVKILSAAGYHVFSLDYRGFGDSSGEPSESGLTTDALFLYHWVKRHSRACLVCLWGHSLGSGVATNSAVKLQEQGFPVEALILEAPYTRIGEVVESHALAKFYTFLPGFQGLLWNILEQNNIVFANDENLKTLTSPLMILHSEDDGVVPHHMGLKLYQISLQTRRRLNTSAEVKMISFSARHGYSHNNVYLEPGLPTMVGSFLQNLMQ